MKGPLYLTLYKQPTYVEGKIVEKLTPYHVDGIRFLYQQCFLKKQNAILNNDPGMQEEREISAFLTALDSPAPSLIVCQPHCLSKWYYEFSQANLEVLTADELIKDDSWETSDLPDAVLITHDQLKHIKTLPVQDWFFFIIQNLERLEKSRYIKNVNAQYRIGLVNQNYLDLTPELQWFAMKWANSGLVEEKEKFIESDYFKKTNSLWPFPDYWRRITWETIKKFQPTLKQLEEYEKTIKEWCKKNKPAMLSICEPAKENQSRPRKRTTKKQNNKNSSTSKRRRVIPKQYSKREALSSDTEDDENISCKLLNRTIQYSSDSDTQDLDLDDIPVQNKKEASNNTSKIKSEAKPTLNESQTPKEESSPSLLDHSKESCFLDSLFDSPEPTTGKQVGNKNDENELKNLENKLKKVESKSDVEDNLILNSLVDSPEPRSSKNQKSKEFRISDDENESCPILDLLF